MEYKDMLPCIMEELAANSEQISARQLEKVADTIIAGNRVFVVGAGRPGFVARAFSNRLMHLGLTVYFVGEPTTPSIQPGDVLVIGSGSGETSSLVIMAQRAKKLGAELVTLTIHPEASIGNLANAVVVIPGATPKSTLADTVKSIQPLGSAFEQIRCP